MSPSASFAPSQAILSSVPTTPGNLQVFAEYKPFKQALNIVMFSESSDSTQRYVALPLAFQSQDNGQIIDPCMSLSSKSAQALFDALWSAGLRPSLEPVSPKTSEGEMKAVQAHLEDMRKITFDLLSLKQ